MNLLRKIAEEEVKEEVKAPESSEEIKALPLSKAFGSKAKLFFMIGLSA